MLKQAASPNLRDCCTEEGNPDLMYQNKNTEKTKQKKYRD
jgi:hypothetical protein